MPTQNGLQFVGLCMIPEVSLFDRYGRYASVKMFMNITVAHQIMGTQLVIIYIYI